MERIMHPVKVNTTVDGDISITQRWNDINERDPEIIISPEQAPLLASWLLESAEEYSGESTEDAPIPCKYWCRGPEADSEQLDVYTNTTGMIVLKISDDAFIEVSPAMAKRLRERLSRAITGALADMFRPDAEA